MCSFYSRAMVDMDKAMGQVLLLLLLLLLLLT
jgi:hypothetical protein